MNEHAPESEDESEDIIDIIGGDEEILIYGFYSQLRLHKEYCSNMQNRYRALTSTWLLAAFGGMGLLLSGHIGIQLPFNTLVGIILLCFCSGFGISLLWFLDVVLYQRLWFANVVELAKLEKAHTWLPRTNLNTILIKESKRYPVFQSYFYIGINGVFVLLSALVSIYYFSFGFIGSCVIAAAGVLLLLLIAYFMLKYSGEKEKITLQSFT